MAYCKFGSSDACVIREEGVIICLACRLTKYGRQIISDALRKHWQKMGIKHAKTVNYSYDDVRFTDRQEVIKHLQVHKKAGHSIPKYAFDRIEREILEEGYQVGR